jgi:hypothetical protein
MENPMARSFPRLLTRSLATALLLPAIASAQDNRDAQAAAAPVITPGTLTPSVTTPPTRDRAATPDATRRDEAPGPQIGQLGVALRARATETAPAPAPAPRGNTSQNRALMIVGVAALITGAVIGGDAGTIVMLGGAGIGLYGLYQFLN